MNVETEVWRDIEDFPDYQVSNLGRVRSLKFDKERILKLDYLNGYLRIGLFNSKGRKTFKVHRLVAQAFIQNPNNFPIINHKNEVTNDNRVENLEWCTHKYNNNYGTIRQKRSEAMRGEKNPNFGKHLSLEKRQKLSEAKRKKNLSQETIQKMSESKKGEKNPNFGKHLSLETRQKISNTKKIYWKNKQQIEKEQ